MTTILERYPLPLFVAWGQIFLPFLVAIWLLSMAQVVLELQQELREAHELLMHGRQECGQ